MKVCKLCLSVIVILISCSTIFVGCDTASTDSTITGIDYDAEYIELSFDETVSMSTHILDAEYIGIYSSEYDTKLLFKPIRAIKGSITPEDDGYIYVCFLDDGTDNENIYKEGEQYMLFLEKNSSVYYDYDKYVQLGRLYIPHDSKEWETYHKKADDILLTSEYVASKSDTNDEAYGVEYTESSNIEEIAAFADNIFVVKVDSVFAESSIAPTTVYNCSVTQTMKNTPANNGNILITMFNGTVEIGEEYIVLLADATLTAPMYALAAKEAVYSVEEAKNMSELKGLLDSAAIYVTGASYDDPMTIWEDEQQAVSD